MAAVWPCTTASSVCSRGLLVVLPQKDTCTNLKTRCRPLSLTHRLFYLNEQVFEVPANQSHLALDIEIDAGRNAFRTELLWTELCEWF